MEIMRIVLKIVMWILIIGFVCNLVMQTISYSFYKKARNKENVTYTPVKLSMTDCLSGYGYHLEHKSDAIVLFFGGSSYTAYNSVGTYGGQFNCPFIAADYYGTKESKGKMNLHTMKKTAEDLYDWARFQYPDRKIIIMGHSYGTGMAAYLASVRDCEALFLLAGYRDLSDLYNKMTPIFWGPLKVFISNNIMVTNYAKNVTCPVYVIGSESDKTLSASLQKKLAIYFNNSVVKVFLDVAHEEYLTSDDVVEYIQSIVGI